MSDTISQTTICFDKHYWSRRYWQDVWQFRRIIWALTWSTILKKYRYTVIGFFWIVLKPLLTFLIFYFVFGRVLRVNDGQGENAQALILAGVLVWQLFQAVFNETSLIILTQSGLIKHCYFPKVINLLSATLLCFGEFFIYFLFFMLFAPLFQIQWDFKLMMAPFVMIFATLVPLSIGTWFSLWMAKYEDVKYISPFLIQISMFISPIGYSVMTVPEPWRGWYSLNPLVGCIEAFRWMLCSRSYEVFWPSVIWSAGFAAVSLGAAMVYLQSQEGVIADEL